MNDQVVIDIERVLDRHPLSAIQRRVVLLLVCAVVLEGFDLQVVAFAAPSLIHEWGITKQALGPAMASALVGMIIGSAAGGRLGDRIGRRPMVVGCIAIFGISTLVTIWAGSVNQIAVLRLMAGVGFGAALTTAMALLAEWLPASTRPQVVSTVIVGVPGGGMLGAALCSWLIPAFGWRAAFVAGGALPSVLVLFMLRYLPESPRFLSVRGHDPSRLISLLNRVVGTQKFRLGDSIASAQDVQIMGRSAVKHLLKAPYLRTTIGVAIAFFSNLAVSYAFFSWTPLLVSTLQYSAAAGIRGSLLFNLAGAVGALLGAYLFARWTPRKRMLAFVEVGLLAVLSLAMRLAGLSVSHHSGAADLFFLMAVLSLAGVGSVGAQAGLYGLVASVYPTPVRATGIGIAGSMGRLGAIASAYGGGWILSLNFGVSAFLVLVALLFALTGFGVWIATLGRASIRARF